MYNVIDLFAGAGGFGLGFDMAGYNLMTSVEYDKWAGETLVNNFNHNIIIDDINNINLCPSLVNKSPDIIIGGPPCQGFSNAGKKDINDPRNLLYKKYLDWVKFFKPKIFIIENVVGILKKGSNHKDIISDIIFELKPYGYNISTWVLNASDFNVPQNRKRAFIIGSINHTIIPKPPLVNLFGKTTKLTVEDAISDLPFLNSGEGQEISDYTCKANTSYQDWARNGSSNVYNHVAMNHTSRVIKRYEEILKGNKLNDLTEDLRVRERSGNGKLSEINYSLNYRLLDNNSPSFTIPAHFYSSFIHPNSARNITAREAARIQSFPDSYIFKGKRTMMSKKLLESLGKESYLSQYNQIGNAVPPLLAMQIAEHIKKYL